MVRKRCLTWMALWLATGLTPASASMGLAELPGNAVSGPVTILYPADAPERPVRRGDFELSVAPDAAPLPGAGRLVVISHGSPASPWLYTGLSRALVEAGYTVALPEHFADNAHDPSEPGPPAWRRRPLEVSRAIDRLAKDERFARSLDLTRVGMYGMSAGGHTALVLAGGRWSPSRLRAHCREHLADDFAACAGSSVALTGGVLDGAKKWIASFVIDHKLDDAQWYGHVDPRIVAVVAGVPFAADFDPESPKKPAVKLALIRAGQDRWLVARFHSDAILAVCQTCELLMDVPHGGHGALLDPFPPGPSAPDLVRDPPDFRRVTEVPLINAAIRDFFVKNLVAADR